MSLSTSAATAVIMTGSSAGLFGIAILSPDSPWFFIPVCIFFAIIGALLREKNKDAIEKILVRSSFLAILGALCGAIATKWAWVVKTFPSGEFIVGALVSLMIAYCSDRLQSLILSVYPSVIIFIKNFLERK